MTIVITITNHKGGSGKTPACWHLAHALAGEDNVLMVDLDPQANLTRRAYSDPPMRHVGRALGGAARPEDTISDLMKPITSSLYIVTAHGDLENTAHGLDSRTWAADRFGALRKAIGQDQRVQNWVDWVLIDTPPNLGTLTVNAMVAADHLVIPAIPDEANLCGILAVSDMAEEIARNLGRGPSILGVIANQVEAQTIRHRLTLDALRAGTDTPRLLAELPKRIGQEAGTELAEQYTGVAITLKELITC